MTALLTDVRLACRMISSEVNRGAMAGNLGLAGSENVQGEQQKTLDVLANDIFLYTAEQGGNYAAMASEELEDVHVVHGAAGRYLLLFDPLDGSSNIDINIAVGSIFSILRLPDGGHRNGPGAPSCSRASSRWRPAMPSTGRRPCWC